MDSDIHYTVTATTDRGFDWRVTCSCSEFSALVASEQIGQILDLHEDLGHSGRDARNRTEDLRFQTADETTSTRPGG